MKSEGAAPESKNEKRGGGALDHSLTACGPWPSFIFPSRSRFFRVRAPPFPEGRVHFEGVGNFFPLGVPSPGAESGPGLVDRVEYCQPDSAHFLKENSRGNRLRKIPETDQLACGIPVFSRGAPNRPQERFLTILKGGPRGGRGAATASPEGGYKELPRAISSGFKGFWPKRGPAGPRAT